MNLPKRELSEVIENMIKEVPKEGHFLKVALEATRSSATYSSPEGMGMFWLETAGHLKDWFGTRTPDTFTDWEKRMIEVFNPEVNFNEEV